MAGAQKPRIIDTPSAQSCLVSSRFESPPVPKSPNFGRKNRVRRGVQYSAFVRVGLWVHTGTTFLGVHLLFPSVQHHPFIDGNRHVGAVAADVCPALNGVELVADESSYADLIVTIARGDISKSAATESFRGNAKPM